MEQKVVTPLCQVHEVCKDLHEQYVAQTFNKAILAVSNTIQRNNLLFFANRPDLPKRGNKTSATQKEKLNSYHTTLPATSVTTKCWYRKFFFFVLKIIRQTPNLADHSSLRSGSTSDILECIKASAGQSSQAMHATIVVLDMAAVIDMVRPTSQKHLPSMLHNIWSSSWNPR